MAAWSPWRRAQVCGCINRKQQWAVDGHRPNHAAWWSPRELVGGETYTGALQLWQSGSDQQDPYHQSKTSKIVTAAWAPDGSQIATGAADGAVELWQATNGSLQGARNWHTAAVNSLLWSADGTTLLSGAKDGSLHIWIIKTLTNTGTISPAGNISWSQYFTNTPGCRSASDCPDGCAQHSFWPRHDVCEDRLAQTERPADCARPSECLCLVKCKNAEWQARLDRRFGAICNVDDRL